MQSAKQEAQSAAAQSPPLRAFGGHAPWIILNSQCKSMQCEAYRGL